MFERFTDRARRVVVLAQEEARLLGHSYIGTEHLLLGLLHEGDGVGAQALAVLGVKLQDVRAEVKEIIDDGGGGTPVGHIPAFHRRERLDSGNLGCLRLAKGRRGRSSGVTLLPKAQR